MAITCPFPAVIDGSTHLFHDILFFILGLALVVIGGNYLTDGATVIARKMHVSGLVIGLTVVAFGSSAPDLVVCMMSTIRDHSQLALGDVVGANIFLILGLCATVRPLDAGTISLFDFQTLVVGAGAVWVFGAFTGPKVISRREGALLIILYALYAAKLILDLTGTRI